MNSLDHLEEKIEKPGYLLLLVGIWMLLVIGFVNLISHQSDPPTLFGMYSIKYFFVLIGYSALLLGWTALLFKPNNDGWLQKTMVWVVNRPLVVLVIFAALVTLNYFVFTFWRFLFFPAIQGVIIGLSLIFVGLLLGYTHSDIPNNLWWRRLGLGIVVGLVVVELVVQGAAFGGLLPSLNSTRQPFSPYDRIYINTENGLQNHTVNKHGWNAPEFRLAEGSHRVLLMGDRQLQALSVDPAENLGTKLDRMVVENQVFSGEAEIINLGHPDYGPGIYANVPLFLVQEEYYQPDEVVVFFDLGNDFQIMAETDGRDVFFHRDENGELNLSWDDSYLRHLYLHQALWGLDGFQPIRSIMSHYLTPKLVSRIVVNDVSASAATVAAPQEDVALPNSFVFYEDLNDEALWLATEHLRLMAEYLDEQGITMRLVTIPVFSDRFYEQGDTTSWTTRFGAADLLLPEQELRAFAEQNGISFLGLGEYLSTREMTPADINELFLDGGRGEFSVAGHDLAAQAVYECFYELTSDQDQGCYVK